MGFPRGTGGGGGGLQEQLGVAWVSASQAGPITAGRASAERKGPVRAAAERRQAERGVRVWGGSSASPLCRSDLFPKTCVRRAMVMEGWRGAVMGAGRVDGACPGGAEPASPWPGVWAASLPAPRPEHAGRTIPLCLAAGACMLMKAGGGGWEGVPRRWRGFLWENYRVPGTGSETKGVTPRGSEGWS